jgi:hypothetical protein
MMFVGAKVKRAVATLRVAHRRSLPLRKETIKRQVAPGEDAEVAVHGENVFIGLKGLRNSYRYRFLADAAKPFADAVLPEENQHLFFDHSRPQQFMVQLEQDIVGVFLAVEFHGQKKGQKYSARTDKGNFQAEFSQ